MKVIVNITKNIVPGIIFFIIFLGVLIGVIAYARGYRFSMNDGTISSTGILSVNSTPQPAKVYVNGQLKGATDINLTLPFGQYDVEVKKEGYTDWKKSVSLKGETVISLDAHLFSKNPSLTPLTNLGIIRAIPLGNTDKIILVSQTGNEEKDGLYLFDAGTRPLAIFPPLNTILLKTTLPEGIDLATLKLDFDPNYKQALATFDYNQSTISYLISLGSENTDLLDISSSKDNLLAVWNEDKQKELIKILETLPRAIRQTAIDTFEVIALSPDEKKLMYLAKSDTTLPLVLNPAMIGANQTQESRSIKKGSLYIYDKKEDKNFRIPVEIDQTILSLIPTPTGAATPSASTETNTEISDASVIRRVQDRVLWYPSSDYVAIKERSQIMLVQYDGENKQTVYAGPFNPDFFSIAPDLNLLVIINLNPNSNAYGDLYSVGIR